MQNLIETVALSAVQWDRPVIDETGVAPELIAEAPSILPVPAINPGRGAARLPKLFCMFRV